MPRNKEALIRYRVINRCFIDYNVISKDKLIGTCEDALDIHPYLLKEYRNRNLTLT